MGAHPHQIFNSLFHTWALWEKKRGRKKIRPVYLELQAFRPDQSMDETEERKERGCTRRWRAVKVVRNICEDEVKLSSFEYKGTKQLCSFSFGF